MVCQKLCHNSVSGCGSLEESNCSTARVFCANKPLAATALSCWKLLPATSVSRSWPHWGSVSSTWPYQNTGGPSHPPAGARMWSATLAWSTAPHSWRSKKLNKLAWHCVPISCCMAHTSKIFQTSTITSKQHKWYNQGAFVLWPWQHLLHWLRNPSSIKNTCITSAKPQPRNHCVKTRHICYAMLRAGPSSSTWVSMLSGPCLSHR